MAVSDRNAETKYIKQITSFETKYGIYHCTNL